ncbi:contractile injection system tape measure protein [Pseudomonas syringae]|uniref:contractile injection system tape measure protein n=1 Tax=Pseudomonas syringae TaxID=317 RepID=UPI003F7624DB
MSSENMIARCRWQSTFDQQDQAAALQDFISQWSHSVLEQELDVFFGERCPAHQTWRIDTLQLDLGDIALEDMALELPRRLRVCLQTAFDELLSLPRSSASSRTESNLRILDMGQTLEDSLIGFLRHGSMPWWFKDARNIQQILDQLLSEQPDRVARILRDLGQSETVRKRVVWQLGETRLGRIIGLLEPWQAEVACTYAHQFIVLHNKRNVPNANSADYRNQVWLSVLSYLLVDRGTLFNTAAFLRSVIGRNARHYGLDPATLLELMFQAVQTLRPLGMIGLAFVTAIEMIYRQDQARLPGNMTAVSTQTLSPPEVDPSLNPIMDARDQLLSDLLQPGSTCIDVWLERQPDRVQALHWLVMQRHVPAVEHWLLAQLPAELNPPQETLKQWGRLLIVSGCWQGAEALLARQLTQLFWSVSLDVRQQRLSAAQLLARMALSASLRLNISLTNLLSAWRTQLPGLRHTQWHEAYATLIQHAQVKSELQTQPSTAATHDFTQDYAGHYLQHPRVLDIARHMLLHGRAPSWLKSAEPFDLTRLLHDSIHGHAAALKALLKDAARRPAVLFRLLQAVTFAWLVDALRVIAPSQYAVLQSLGAFHHWLLDLALPAVSRAQREAVLFELLLKRGLAGDWAALQPVALVETYVAQLVRQRPVSRAALYSAMAPQLGKLPSALCQAVGVVLRGAELPHSALVPVPAPFKTDVIENVALPISNAGLVLLHGFITPLFSWLKLTEECDATAKTVFVSELAQRRAVHVLQFLASGLTETPEHYLTLNKLLCGVAIEQPVELSIELHEAERALCHSLMTAVIGHWPAIGKTSFEGLRGNWLIRSGVLQRSGERWHLSVERRAYDLLLARCPFTYSVIKLPWMEKPLYVTWPT